jgi:hypothetical protein
MHVSRTQHGNTGLHSMHQALSSMDVEGQQVFVPDDRGCLSPAAELTYNDAPWLDSAGPTRAAHVVHPKISNEVDFAEDCLLLLHAHQLCRVSKSQGMVHVQWQTSQPTHTR